MEGFEATCTGNYLRTIRLIMAVTILVVATSAEALGQPQATTPPWRKMADKSASFTSLSQDLLDMAKARQPGFEFNLTEDLCRSAGTAAEYFIAARDLLWVYAQITNSTDRANVKPYINRQLAYYSQKLEIEIKRVNLDMSYLASAGIAATAARLRDELREGVGLLKSAASE